MMVWVPIGFRARNAPSRRCLMRIFLLLMMAVGVCTPCLMPNIVAAESSSSLESKIRTLKERLTSGKKKAKGHQSKLEQIETKRARVTANLREQERIYQIHNDRLTALEQRRDALRWELTHHRTSLVQQVRTAFTIGRQEKL